MNQQETIADRLKEAMAVRKIGGAALAAKMDMGTGGQSQISRWRGGEGMEAETIRSLADALGVSFEWLASGRGGGPNDAPDVTLPVGEKRYVDTIGRMVLRYRKAIADNASADQLRILDAQLEEELAELMIEERDRQTAVRVYKALLMSMASAPAATNGESRRAEGE